MHVRWWTGHGPQVAEARGLHHGAPMTHLPTRRREPENRRRGRRGGRRLTDRRPDIPPGVSCAACGTAVAALLTAEFVASSLRLTYHCRTCGQLQQFATDPFLAILAVADGRVIAAQS
jgi:hypothetical protein